MNLFSSNKIAVWALLCTGLLFFFACSTDNEDELFAERDNILAAQGCDINNTELSFKDCIAPIIETNCGSSCHSANLALGGVVLTNYDEIKVYVDNGRIPIVIDPDDLTELMPTTGKMPDLNITLIKNWIEQGALNN